MIASRKKSFTSSLPNVLCSISRESARFIKTYDWELSVLVVALTNSVRSEGRGSWVVQRQFRIIAANSRGFSCSSGVTLQIAGDWEFHVEQPRKLNGSAWRIVHVRRAARRVSARTRATCNRMGKFARALWGRSLCSLLRVI